MGFHRSNITPTLTFTKTDTSQTETLTVASASPTNIYWSDFTILVDGTDAQHTLTGTVDAGDTFNTIYGLSFIWKTGFYRGRVMLKWNQYHNFLLHLSQFLSY